MAQGQPHESTGSEMQTPATDAFTHTPGAATTKGGPGNWGTAARWFVFALLAIAFVICLNVFF